MAQQATDVGQILRNFSEHLYHDSPFELYTRFLSIVSSKPRLIKSNQF